MGTVELTDMEFYAFHGCYAQERAVGNYFLVDLRFDVDARAASLSDDLSDTVSYLDAYEVVAGAMSRPSRLLEHVARRILDDLSARFGPRISNVQVRVRKQNPPLGGRLREVSVTLRG